MPAKYTGATLFSERKNAMKVTGPVRISVLAAFAIAAASSLHAQVIVSSQGVVGAGGGVGASGVALGLRGLEGAPYSATRTTTRVQTLADGTTITHTTTAKEARDSEGRTYHATELDTALTGRQHVTIYNVFDPVNGIQMNWTSNSQTVTLNHFPQPQPAHHVPVQQNNQVTTPVPPRVQPKPNPDFHIEDLGTQNINGVLAHGRRITRIIPAGSEGNDQQITVTEESWTSSELHTDVLQITDDPRTGNSRVELSDIDRNEPDPSLFQAPAGYTVQEMQPVQRNVEDTNPQ